MPYLRDMAETEVILTVFKADTSELDAAVGKYEKDLGAATKASDKLDASTTNLGASVGQVAPKFEAVRQSADRSAKAVAQVTNETKKAGAAGGLIGKLQAGFANIGNGLKGTAAGINGFFGQIAQGVSSAVPGIGGIGSAFTGLLGPIGIAAAAVGGGLLAIAKNTDAGKTAIEGFSIGFGSSFDRVTGVVKRAGEDVKSFFDEFVTESEVGSEAFRIFKAVFTSGLSEIFENSDQDFGQQIANRLDELEDKQLAVNEATARNEITIRANLAALRNSTLPLEDRLRLADEITTLEAESLQATKSKLKEEYKILSAQAARQQVLKGEIDDELKQQLSSIRVQVSQAEAESVSLTERVAARRAGIVEAEEQRKLKAVQDANAARAKAEAERAKNAAIIEQAQRGIDATLSKLAEEQLAANVTTAEREVLAVEKKYADIVKATEEGFAKIREVSALGDQAEIFQQEANAIVEIDKAKNIELAALEKARADEAAKTREDQLEQVRQSLLTETEAQREAILVKLDLDRAAAEAAITNKEERDATILELTKKAEQDLNAVLTDEQQKRLDADKAFAEQQAAIQQQQAESIAAAAEESLSTIIQAAAAGEDAQKQASKAVIGIFLDTLEKIVLGQALAITTGSAADGAQKAGAPGAIAGLAAGAVIAGVIKGLFGILKAQIAGAYTGEERVGVGEKPIWSGKDGYLRRVHKNEGIVDASTNMEFLPEMRTMRKGRKAYEAMIHHDYIAPAIAALGHRDDAKVNDFVASDMGQRIASSVMLAKFYDANIVSALTRNGKYERQNTELLAALVKNTRRTSSRYH